MERKQLLQVNNLNAYFKTTDGTLQAIKDVSFEVREGELMALVGESGCGKSLSSLSIMGLTAKTCTVKADSILLGDKDLTKLKPAQLRKMRGKEMAMIFQEPLTSLNPLFTIGFQLIEAIRLHNDVTKAQAREMAIDILTKVEIPRPEAILKEYPNALSGGMRQRVMIAMALVNKPKLLIADEPTTALDVTIQAQILSLMKHLMKDSGTSILFITHDLGVVAEVADYVIVMYAGEIVENGTVQDIFHHPLHPYTRGLMNSTIRIDQSDDKLDIIPGTVPTLKDMPEGCRFNPRCPYATDACRDNAQGMMDAGNGRMVRCCRWNEIGGEQK